MKLSFDISNFESRDAGQGNEEGRWTIRLYSGRMFESKPFLLEFQCHDNYLSE